jgi:hypothetical protein
MLASLLSGKSYIELVKDYIGKIFTHEEKKFKCEPGDISVIIHKGKQGDIQIMIYSNPENIVLRILPDKEAEQILMK